MLPKLTRKGTLTRLPDPKSGKFQLQFRKQVSGLSANIAQM